MMLSDHQILKFQSFIARKELRYPLTFLIILLASLLLISFTPSFEPQTLLFRFGRSPSQSPSPPPQTLTLSQETCDYSNGRWVRDENYFSNQLYGEDCRFLDPGFRCRESGRKDLDYLKWRWQPYGCDLPRFNASDLLERSRNRRIVFAGDSIGRNQWESFLCMLAQGVSNISTIYEVNNNPISKHKGFLIMRFPEYNLTVEYYRAPFLVVIGRPPKSSSKEIKLTIRVDEFNWLSKKWEGGDIIVFNTGHWWNEFKTIKAGIYFQENGEVNMTMDIMDGFERSLQTWKSWVIQKLEPKRSHIFFRSYSPVHYRNGTWNLGGQCDADKEPETNHTNLEPDPVHNKYISNVIDQMQYTNMKVEFLNITYLTEFRSDGHPSLHREPGTPADAPQDCSHWCLPGVPDTWNEILYAQLLMMGYGNL